MTLPSSWEAEQVVAVSGHMPFNHGTCADWKEVNGRFYFRQIRDKQECWMPYGGQRSGFIVRPALPVRNPPLVARKSRHGDGMNAYGLERK